MWWILNLQAAQLPADFSHSQPVPELGPARGVEVLQNHVYLYGDGTEEAPGIVREYRLAGDKLQFTGKQMRFTAGKTNAIPHPTGLTHDPKFGTWIGNTVDGKGTLFRIHWSRLYRQGNLEDAVLHSVVDDAAVNGSRPEFVRHAGKVFLASADNGPKGNEVRLYDPTRLSRAGRTREPGVVVHRFSVGPWVQSLYFWEERDALVLSQNAGAGSQWKMTVLDLTASVQQGKAVELESVVFPYGDELEGMHVFGNLAIGISSASPGQVRVGKLPAAPP